MFSTQKISTKIVLTISIFLTLSLLTFSGLIINKVQSNTKKNSELLKTEIGVQIQDKLDSELDIVKSFIIKENEEAQNIKTLEAKYGQKLKTIIDIVEVFVNSELKAVQEGNYSKNQAIVNIKKFIDDLRYDDGEGYVWVNSTDLPFPTMILHPIIPQLNGSILDDVKYNVAANKQNLFQAAVEKGLNSGEGFIDYTWPKPTENGLVENVPKISYVRLIPELNWIVGTGVYAEDEQVKFENTLLTRIQNLRFDDGEGYFYIISDDRPYPKMIMHPINPELNGKELSDTKFNNTEDGKNIYVESQNIAIDKSQKLVKYHITKPGESELSLKLSRAVHVPELKWIVGTGIYADTVEDLIKAKNEESAAELNQFIMAIIGGCIILIILSVIISKVFSNKVTSQLDDVKNGLDQMAQGETIEEIEAKTNDELKDMIFSLNKMSSSMSDYSQYAKEIGKGNLEVEFNVDRTEKDILANSLMQMKNDLSKVRSDEEIRKWTAEGLALFGELMRSKKDNLEEFSFQVIKTLIKYTDCNQGALFVINTDGAEPKLELTSSYAYDRRKFQNMELSLGEGLVGQCILEKDRIYMSKVPDNYINISSGLGEATPKEILIMPLKVGEEVFGAVEMASFRVVEEYKMDFIEKVCLLVASELASVKTNIRTKKLLEESQQMSEVLKAQEEELRQNQEELQATTEELERTIIRLEKENKELKEKAS